jgi:hypothetical protein
VPSSLGSLSLVARLVWLPEFPTLTHAVVTKKFNSYVGSAPPLSALKSPLLIDPPTKGITGVTTWATTPCKPQAPWVEAKVMS